MKQIIFVYAIVSFVIGCETFDAAVQNNSNQQSTVVAEEVKPLVRKPAPRTVSAKKTLSDADVRRLLNGEKIERAGDEVRKVEVKQEEEKPSEPTLVDFTKASNRVRPKKDMIYGYKDDDLRVYQVIEVPEEEGCPAYTWVLASDGIYSPISDLLIGIINEREYVTGELVENGKYRYIGPYTYETAPVVDGVEQKRRNTVRIFVEVGCEFDKFVQKARAEKK